MSKKTSVIKNCVICGEPFTVQRCSINKILCCSNKCAGKFKQRRFDKSIELKLGQDIGEWVYQRYRIDKMSYRQIRESIHINHRTLMRYMKEFKIPQFSRSESIALQWVNNDLRRKAQSEFFKSIPHPSGEDNPTKRPEVREKIRLSKLGDKNPMYNVLGKDNPLWKGGKNTYRGKGWNSIRKQVLRRDNLTCQQCGSKERLEVHHIVTYRNRKTFNKLTNLVTLCHDCHRKQLSHKL